MCLIPSCPRRDRACGLPQAGLKPHRRRRSARRRPGKPLRTCRWVAAGVGRCVRGPGALRAVVAPPTGLQAPRWLSFWGGRVGQAPGRDICLKCPSRREVSGPAWRAGLRERAGAVWGADASWMAGVALVRLLRGCACLTLVAITPQPQPPALADRALLPPALAFTRSTEGSDGPRSTSGDSRPSIQAKEKFRL